MWKWDPWCKEGSSRRAGTCCVPDARDPNLCGKEKTEQQAVGHLCGEEMMERWNSWQWGMLFAHHPNCLQRMCGEQRVEAPHSMGVAK